MFIYYTWKTTTNSYEPRDYSHILINFLCVSDTKTFYFFTLSKIMPLEVESKVWCTEI